ncbi:MAG: RecB family exonuclease [Chloroflexota bacterium]
MTEPDTSPAPRPLTGPERAAALDPGGWPAILAAHPLPTRHSYSSLAAFAACPYRYALRYVLRIPGPPVPAFAFGSAVHGALETFTRKRRARGGALPSRAELGAWFGAAWEQRAGEVPDAEMRAGFAARAPAILDGFWAAEAAAGEDGPEVLREERGFRLALDAEDGGDPVVVSGVIDRIDRHRSGAVEVIDYKTGRAESQADPDENLQLTIYALACRDALALGRPERLTLWFVEAGTRLHATRSDAELDRARAEIAARVARIRAGDFRATPSAGACRWCDYRTVCPVAIPG